MPKRFFLNQSSGFSKIKFDQNTFFQIKKIPPMVKPNNHIEGIIYNTFIFVFLI
jgi:hypothetical protein